MHYIAKFLNRRQKEVPVFFWREKEVHAKDQESESYQTSQQLETRIKRRNASKHRRENSF